MVSLAKLLRIRREIGKKYKNIGLEKFRLPIFYKVSFLKSETSQIVNMYVRLICQKSRKH
jgi:hypothetical protein